MATYSTAVRFVQAFNVTAGSNTVSFTVPDNQYFQVTAFGCTAGSGTTITITLSGVEVFSGTIAASQILSKTIIGENTPVVATVSSGNVTVFGVLLA